MSGEKVAVVTGGNKGIGFEIVKGLCEQFVGNVYLTARDVERGQEAVSKLNQLGLKPHFHQLDITDKSSIEKLKEHIVTKYGGLDLLINNAAILSVYKPEGTKTLAEVSEHMITVNYTATRNVCNILFPILRKNAKVVNVSSRAGVLAKIPSAEIREKFKNPNLTIPQLDELMEKFITDVKNNRQVEEWGNTFYVGYCVSKIGVSRLTFLQQQIFDNETPFRNISVNCVHPGYVKTDLTGNTGPLTTKEGAEAPLYLALKANLKGQFIWNDKEVIDWYSDQEKSY